MQKTKILIVYSANSPAAEFILHGADKGMVSTLKLELKNDYCSKVLFLLFYLLRLYKLSSCFRFKSNVRTEIARQENQILFWDCCDLYLYKLLDRECNSKTKKSIFFWNSFLLSPAVKCDCCFFLPLNMTNASFTASLRSGDSHIW